ncbi:interferon-induced GTP-binding protein Mx1 [Apiospora arundinis]|uniref:Interferon-induced GTP-binding protein Mx1 n=1 Tax=Apiospora arundinis TaxID=335852 RepID=A0ABR2IFD7_9PEZI
MAKSEVGLGNQTTLTKIDKLRELNVGAIIPLPQIVVVGDQSSGKSSVLESVTGFSFPRGAGLCTRYATQITCRRAAERCIYISIIPRPNADEQIKKQILDFKYELPGMSEKELVKIFEEANVAMGIRMSKSDPNDGRSAFSQDILKIEICGPGQDHLTIIDVPGIFRVATPGLTTESDIMIVENMVKSYMNDPRTIILAIVPCNVDLATQGILKLAERADPTGVRTMGVLTKPDLATENASKETIRDLVMGRGSHLKLGCHVVKNRGADDKSSTSSERSAAEEAFFMGSAWLPIADRCGTDSLIPGLRGLLMNISKQEMPHVKIDIEEKLQACKGKLEVMGPPRATEQSQRLYLAKLASRFQDVTRAALNGYYAGDKIFKDYSSLRLTTLLMKLNEDFARVFDYLAPKSTFAPGSACNDSEAKALADKESHTFGVLARVFPELSEILHEVDYICPAPKKNAIMGLIQGVYASGRGPELGTFGGNILATAFEEQTEKWEPLVLSHTSRAITLVHRYILQLLTTLCPEKQVREQLWGKQLIDKLFDAYRRAMDHSRFLLSVERGGRPTTFNHYFNDTLQQKRADRVGKALEEKAQICQGSKTKHVSIEDIKMHTQNKSNTDQVCEDILDTLLSYYKVARKRLVDNVCQQVILHFLLEGEQSPLRVMGTELVMSLDSEQLESIAGEDSESKRKRKSLEQHKERLEAALKVLRT